MITNCPKCGEKTVLLNGVCEHCGCETRACPECGNIVEKTQESCNYCGVQFETFTQREAAQKEKVEKAGKREDVKKQALNLAICAESKAKTYKRIGYGIFAVALIFGVIIAVMLINFTEAIDEGGLEAIKYIADFDGFMENVTALSIIAFIICVVQSFINQFRIFFIASSLRGQALASKFNYKAYYKNFPLDAKGRIVAKNLSSGNVQEQGDILLAVAMIGGDDRGAYTSIIWNKIINFVLSTMSGIFLVLGVLESFESILIARILDVPFTFELNALLIAAIIFWVAGMVSTCIFKDEKRAVQKWIKKIKETEE